MTLKAGIARRDITPSSPMYLLGYPHFERISTGVHDPLYATALYLHDGIQAVIFISVDVLMLSHITVCACRDAISLQTGVPHGSILISTTHTHSAPVTVELLAFRGDALVPPVDPGYLAQVQDGIVAAAVGACQGAVPAQAAFTNAQVEGVGGNRHDPQGVRDPQVGLLVLRRVETRMPLVVSLVYSMHPTILHEDSRLVTADFPGFTRAALESYLPGAQVIYHTGPCGNQSPRYHVSAQTFSEAERLGNRLADMVIQSIDRLQEKDFTSDVPLAADQAFVELPERAFPPLAEAEARLQAAVAYHQELVRSGALHGPVRTAEVDVFGAEEAVVLARAQASGEIRALRKQYTPVEVQVIRVGPVFYVGLPGELFVEYGLAIKQQAGMPAYVISLANGELQGYIVTPDASGYEASFSLFMPEAGQVLVEAALTRIKSIQ
jgi:neutral ceramidase